MSKREKQAVKISDNTGSRLFVFGIIFIVFTMCIDFFVDRELFSKVMYYIQQKTLPPFTEIKPYQLLLTMLFAFGMPFGLVLIFVFAIKNTESSSPYKKKLIFSSFGIFAIVLLTPAIFGRELSSYFFGIFGYIILISILITFWLTSRFRNRLDKAAKVAFDFKLLGYLCFGIVAWQICSFAFKPSYAIYPSKMLEFEVRPFAIGQLKSIMIYFVCGWILTAIGFYKSMKQYM